MTFITLWVNYRALVGMMMYNPETAEIAKPTELLCSVKAIVSVLQSIENYSKCVDHFVSWNGGGGGDKNIATLLI